MDQLAKTETRVKDDHGQEVTEETFLSAYQEVQGTKQAMTFTIKRDGLRYLEGEVAQSPLAEKLDDRVFAKPPDAASDGGRRCLLQRGRGPGRRNGASGYLVSSAPAWCHVTFLSSC